MPDQYFPIKRTFFFVRFSFFALLPEYHFLIRILAVSGLIKL
jgi:hypothetical protein